MKTSSSLFWLILAVVLFSAAAAGAGLFGSGKLLLSGVLSYFLYNAASLAFGVAYNRLFRAIGDRGSEAKAGDSTSGVPSRPVIGADGARRVERSRSGID